jgi:hypothetical protein
MIMAMIRDSAPGSTLIIQCWTALSSWGATYPNPAVSAWENRDPVEHQDFAAVIA